MTPETARKRALGRAVASVFRQGIDPLSNQSMFDAAVRDRMERWESEHGYCGKEKQCRK